MAKEIRLLEADEIEVRINQVGAKGASALLYKTARVDYEILDETFGRGNWMVDYQEIKGNLFCTISIWDEEKRQWIRKTNCGVESREDGNGNEKKGEASDAAKRAGTVVGIGRELYSSPFVWLNVATEKDERSGRYQLKDKFAKFSVSEIGYDRKRKINRLVIVNTKTGEKVYTFGEAAKSKPKAETRVEPKAQVEVGGTVPGFDSQAAYKAFIEKYQIEPKTFLAWRTKAAEDPETGVTKDKSCKDLSPEEWKDLLVKLALLADKGYFHE